MIIDSIVDDAATQARSERIPLAAPDDQAATARFLDRVEDHFFLKQWTKQWTNTRRIHRADTPPSHLTPPPRYPPPMRTTHRPHPTGTSPRPIARPNRQPIQSNATRDRAPQTAPSRFAAAEISSQLYPKIKSIKRPRNPQRARAHTHIAHPTTGLILPSPERAQSNNTPISHTQDHRPSFNRSPSSLSPQRRTIKQSTIAAPSPHPVRNHTPHVPCRRSLLSVI